MLSIANKPPLTTEPENPPRRAPLMWLRLSDGRTWAYKFGASSPHDLRDGCRAAWVACAAEWHRRANALPSFQTLKRAAMLESVPRALELHVLHEDAWLNANYGTDSARCIAIRRPGTAANVEAWEEAAWEQYFLRCLRCWNGAESLFAFCRRIPKFLKENGA